MLAGFLLGVLCCAIVVLGALAVCEEPMRDPEDEAIERRLQQRRRDAPTWNSQDYRH